MVEDRADQVHGGSRHEVGHGRHCVRKGHDGRVIYSDLPNEPEMRELVEFFIQELAHHVHEMEDAVKARDWEKLDIHVHQLKGAGGGFGFAVISEIAGKVEGLIRGGKADDGEIGEAAGELIAVCRCVGIEPV